MAISVEDVPMWTHKAGHALMWSEGDGDDTRWSQTICGIRSIGHYRAVPSRPKRVCKKCRGALERAEIKAIDEPKGSI